MDDKIDTQYNKKHRQEKIEKQNTRLAFCVRLMLKEIHLTKAYVNWLSFNGVFYFP